jgi:hypothetical protein
VSGTVPPGPGQQGLRPLAWSLVGATVADPGLDGLAASLQRVCRAVSGRLPVRGAAVRLMTADSDAVAASSDGDTRWLAELQFTCNEGPGLVAFRTQRPVLVPDLERVPARWPGFSSLATEHGARGVFSFPLQEGAVSLGVLELYADHRAGLDRQDIALAGAFAKVATEIILDAGTTRGGELDPALAAPLGDRDRIHQAQGMVMVDLGISLVDALARMRAHAFARNLTLVEIAHQVIAGTLAGTSWDDDD